MGDYPPYRIVFRGDIAYGFTQKETRAKLKRLCKYDDATLDRLFSRTPTILKKGLSFEQARKYKAALDETGAVCTIERNNAAVIKQPVRSAKQTLICPKCGKEQSRAQSCIACGIVFAKYQQIQLRRSTRPDGSGTASPYAVPEEHDEGDLLGRCAGYLGRHQEQAFILKAFLVIASIICLTKYFSGLLALFIFLFPVLFLVYVRFEAAATDRPPSEVLAQHITFMPVMYAEGERKKEGVAWVTYGLILVNVLIFYGFEMIVSPDFILDNLVFLPHKPNFANGLVSLFSSMFLHAGTGHLWGNMLFLWAIGTVVEKRIGAIRFLVFYFLAGITASVLSAVVYFAFFHEPVHGLGASGAIAGVMGLFAIRCYFKSMVFPLPILGIFSLILPISLKVRLNSLVIIGLFFLMDLSGGIGQLTGQNDSHIGHWAHIGGMVCGILLGMLFKLGDEAMEERHQEIGHRALKKGGDLYKGEESLRLALQRNPGNGETMILLASMITKFETTEEGEKLYRKGLDILSRSRIKDAAKAFKEYYARYLKGAHPATMLRLAAYFHQQQDLEWAVRCLELVSDNTEAPQALREKAMFQCARQLEHLGKPDIALHYYRQFVDIFPHSPLHGAALARLNAS